MARRRIGRKLWRKFMRAALFAAMAGSLGSTQAHGAEVTMSGNFTDAVGRALVDGREGTVLCSQTFKNQRSVYVLLERSCVEIDAPEIFLGNQCYVTYQMITCADGSGYRLSAEIERYEKTNDLDADAIVSDLCLEGHSDLEIAIMVHDWLTESLEYGKSEKTLGECLAYGYGKCDDYSMIYAAVMNAAGVKTRCMDGVPSGSTSGHMWNMVCINDSWYLCDVTNDDLDGNYSHFMKSLSSSAVQSYLGDYLGGYRLCNGVDEFLSYRMADKNYSTKQISKCIAKLDRV